MSAAALETAVKGLRRRSRSLGLGAGALWALATLLGAVMMWAWIDLLTDPPGWLRLAGCVLALGCGVAVFVRQARRTSAACTTGAVARSLDAAAGARGQILSGIDLHSSEASGGSNETILTQGLSTLAVSRAGTLAAGVERSEAAPARPVVRAGAGLCGVAAVLALLVVIVPNLVRTQWLRLTDPFGDYAPYSRVQIHVQPGDVDVVYGGAVEIRATVEGGAVDQLETVLVAQGAAGAGGEPGQEVIPMFAEPDGGWRTALANVTTGGKYFVRARQARSQSYGLRVVTVPKITAVAVRITSPAYTRQGVYEGVVPAGGIAVLAGAEVEFQVRSNRPLSGGAIEIAGSGSKHEVALAPTGGEEPGEVRGGLKVDAAGKLTIRVKDTAGQMSTDAFSTSVTLLADQRPFVRIVEPRSQSFATPTAELPVDVMAEDDYGVTGVILYRSLNDSRALGLELKVPPQQPQRMRGATMLAFAPLGLHPGDVIKMVGRVEDNDPLGAKGSESAATTIQIISQEDFERMMVSRAGLEMLLSKYQQAQRHMETIEAALRKMKDELAKQEAEKPLGEADKKQNNAVAAEAAQGAVDVAKARDVALPFDVDKTLTPHLDRIVKRLEEVAGKLKEGDLSKMKVKDQQAVIDALINAVQEEEKQFAQDVIEPLDYLAKIFPLIEDQEKFVQIYKRQAWIVERLAGIKEDAVEDPRQKARMRDMEGEQKEIRQHLSELVEAIASHAAELPDDPEIDEFRKTAQDFARDVRNSDADDHMVYSERALGDFSPAAAQREATAAAEILKRFILQQEGGGGMGAQANGALKFQPVLGKILGNTIAQLLGAGGAGGGGSGEAGPGVYGTLPIAVGSKGGGNNRNRGAVAGGSTGRDAEGSGAVGSNVGPARGASAVPVPAQYRRRVDQYFQRVADELQKE